MQDGETKNAAEGLTQAPFMSTNAKTALNQTKAANKLAGPNVLQQPAIATRPSTKDSAVMRGTLKRLPHPRDLSWCAALAWICTRDAEFVKNYQELPANQSLDDAICHLDDDLSRWLQTRRGRTSTRRPQAEAELLRALSNGAIEAYGRNLTQSRGKIAPTVWHLVDMNGKQQHNNIHQWGICPDTRDEVIRTVYEDVQILQGQILARWCEWPELLTEMREGPRWRLNETLYWIKHRSHVGYRDPPAGRRGSAFGADETASKLRDRLSAGIISCRARLRSDHSTSAREMPKEFWIGHGLGDVADATFVRNEVVGEWRHLLKAESFSRFNTQVEAVSFVMHTYDLPRTEARRLVQDSGMSKTPPGRKAKSPK